MQTYVYKQIFILSSTTLWACEEQYVAFVFVRRLMLCKGMKLHTEKSKYFAWQGCPTARVRAASALFDDNPTGDTYCFGRYFSIR